MLRWRENSAIRSMEWPAQSPDLSPIKNLWGDVKRQLSRNPARHFWRTGVLASGLLFLFVGAWNWSGVFQEEYRTVYRHVVDIPDTSDRDWLNVTHIVLFYKLGASILITVWLLYYHFMIVFFSLLSNNVIYFKFCHNLQLWEIMAVENQ